MNFLNGNEQQFSFPVIAMVRPGVAAGRDGTLAP